MLVPTPLVRLRALDPHLYAKVEYLHPSGSMKHRAIPPFLESLIARGKIERGQTIAVRSVGAAAVATAWAGAQLGCPVVAVLPPFAPEQLLRTVRWLGATGHRAPPEQGMALMKELAARPDVYVLAQGEEAGLVEYYRIVAAEVLDELGEVAALTVGIGTGLSIMGIHRECRARGALCAVYGAEPAESAVASGEPWRPHPLLGLAPPIPQPLLDTSLLAGIEPVPSEEALRCARDVAQSAGLMIGPSAGAAVAAARRLRARGLTGPLVAVCACAMPDYFEVLAGMPW